MSGRQRPDAPESLVVGGGVIGLAVAYELARRGRRVSVLERGRPGGGATRAAGGMLAPVSEAGFEEPDLLRLGLDSLARYPDFVAELERVAGTDCGYDAAGTLWVATKRDERAELERLEASLLERRLPVERLGAERVARLEPHLSARILAGWLVEGDHQVDPRRLAAALERGIGALGGRVLPGRTVLRVETDSGRVSGVSGRDAEGGPFRLEAREVVWAAGAWDGSAVELPIDDPGVRPVKGQLVRLRGPRLVTRVVRTPEVYLVPRRDGALLVGATTEEAGFDGRPTAGAVLDLLRRARDVLPGCRDLELVEVCVGFRPAARDHLPVLGATGVDGLFLAVGHYRGGVLLAPATAHHVAEAVVRGRNPEALEPFRAGRLGRPERRTSGR